MECEENHIWTRFEPEGPLTSKVDTIFQNVITPIYGSQTSSLQRIHRGEDRRCELLIRENKEEILGLIVYKICPNSDFKRYELSNSFEIKNFVLLDSNKTEPETEYTGTTLTTARKMYMKLQQLALQSGAETMHIIISDRQTAVVNFFKSQNFIARKRWKSEQLFSYALRYQASRPRADGRDSRPLRITLHNQYIRAIRSGQKTVEGRCGTTMFTPIRVGRLLEFFCRTDSIKCEVVSIQKYKSFPEMLRKEGVDKCIPGLRSMKEACDVYNRLPGYTEKAARFGVLAFRLRAIT